MRSRDTPTAEERCVPADSDQNHHHLNSDPTTIQSFEPGLKTSSPPSESQANFVRYEFEMDESTAAGSDAPPHARSRGARSSIKSTISKAGSQTGSLLRKQWFAGAAQHTVGLILLLCVVFLWTLSNFLGSSIFADSSYAKPFFLTYLNTSIFVFALVPTSIRWTVDRWRNGTLRNEFGRVFSVRNFRLLLGRGRRRNHDEEGRFASSSDSGVDAHRNGHDEEGEETEAFIKPRRQTEEVISSGWSETSYSRTPSAAGSITRDNNTTEAYLGLVPTAQLSFAFCILWFGANYFAMGCLRYTTVASATILTSTSSIWTLLIGSLTRTEKFTWRKLCGVLASLAGIVLISHVDLSSPAEPASSPTTTTSKLLSMMPRRRTLDAFPDKPATELALGDALALLSAIIYGFYTITLKRSTIKADPLELHMPTFFGLVGLFNLVLLLPLFPVLHFTGIEPFELPPTRHIWIILIINSISSFASDIMWAYAMVFTSPLLVTVGLSLTIPLSLVGEMIVQARYESWMYWVGAMVVVGSFVFVEREEVREEEEQDDHHHHDPHKDTTAMLRHAEEGGAAAGAGAAGSLQTSRLDPGHGGNESDENNNNNVDDNDLADLMGRSSDEDDVTRDRLQRQADGFVVHD